MVMNINVVISDKSYDNLKRIKREARFRTNADVVQFALDVAVNSQAFENLKEGRSVGAALPVTQRIVVIEKSLHGVLEWLKKHDPNGYNEVIRTYMEEETQ